MATTEGLGLVDGDIFLVLAQVQRQKRRQRTAGNATVADQMQAHLQHGQATVKPAVGLLVHDLGIAPPRRFLAVKQHLGQRQLRPRRQERDHQIPVPGIEGPGREDRPDRGGPHQPIHPRAARMGQIAPHPFGRIAAQEGQIGNRPGGRTDEAGLRQRRYRCGCGLERGQRNPTIETVYALAKALGVGHLDLLTPTDND